MENQDEKFGIVMSIVVTAIALVLVGSTSATHDGSISAQGEWVIDQTTSELKNVPDTIQDLTSDALDTADTIIEESNSMYEAVDRTTNTIENKLPNVPKVIKQNDGKLLELVSIPPETSVPGCEESNTCFLPAVATLSTGGEVIWTNHDDIPHTITSGNPQNGPDGLFDSGLMMPGDTYSLTFDLVFEYDYFCLVHPWMQGSIVVT
ncbi:plastocyanin/azurin family copper-binding protein [Nitrosopumilus sp.]|uniref:cupredoxin domain-containing protein n=1 Tax=Nitrosopumilus sp. TaxID=2024843 RepID=UPI00247EA077|nr:plastocyanin/azurin family copper-binding protein [Nitrosopumilus sp.]MCV0411353.1 hypothetical protein [Nitrosopumilus sp.]